MAKLYPPIINSKLPAFCLDNGEILINLPYQLNPMVGEGEFTTVRVVIKDLSNTKILLQIDKKPVNSIFVITQDDIKEGDNPFVIGTYYKVQMAFVKDNEVGYWSDTGIIKCIGRPSCGMTGSTLLKLKGQYVNPNDSTEDLYSYRFLMLLNGEEVINSGEIVYNHAFDTAPAVAKFEWEVPTILDEGTYEIRLITTTMNGYVVTTGGELALAEKEFPFNGFLYAENNIDCGCVDLTIASDPASKGRYMDGNFGIVREEYGSGVKEKLAEFQLYQFGETEPRLIWRDNTVEQGRCYTYFIYYIYEDNSRSEFLPMDKEYVYADFEDIYLSDNEHTLKIRFNPNVSSFKRVIQESKIDTLGSKYPFFFRNGDMSYEEFAISGLLSVIADEQGLFFAENSPTFAMREGTTTSWDQETSFKTSLSPQNYFSERKFKLAVYEWLTNGKPKIMRTDAEGNYIVRLMNVALQPQATISRMLHSFSATALTIADYNIASLKKYNLLLPVEAEYLPDGKVYAEEWEKIVTEWVIVYPNEEDYVSNFEINMVDSTITCSVEGEYYPNTLDDTVDYLHLAVKKEATA